MTILRMINRKNDDMQVGHQEDWAMAIFPFLYIATYQAKRQYSSIYAFQS